MKATLEFTLPEDDHDFKCACKAAELYCVLRQLDEDMRAKIKHVDMDATPRQWLEQWRQDINEAIQGIEL